MEEVLGKYSNRNSWFYDTIARISEILVMAAELG
jgi:hypothetical protein